MSQMVDWEVAVAVGGRLAGPGPTVHPEEAAAAVAELRAGLPPTLAVAGGYLDGIGVPACVAAATRAAASLVMSGVAR